MPTERRTFVIGLVIIAGDALLILSPTCFHSSLNQTLKVYAQSPSSRSLMWLEHTSLTDIWP